MSDYVIIYYATTYTLPETDMAPENNPLENEILDLEPIIFRDSFREGPLPSNLWN